MKNIIAVLLIACLALAGCTMDASKEAGQIINGVSQGDAEKIGNAVSGAFVQCDPPYMRHGTECCLDKNDNKICDYDEDTGTTPPAENTADDSNEAETEPDEPAPVANCAEHFTEVAASEVAICGGGSIGDSPITDAYGCKGDPNYPSSGCAAGTSIASYYSSPDGTTPEVICSVSQTIGVTVSPSGCPIIASNVTCPTGFAFDAANSKLTWQGGGSSWGCWYKCNASPDPYAANPKWPCTKPGYAMTSGGGGSVCCAKW